MSERSSFVSEYLYCKKCCDAVAEVFKGSDDKYGYTRKIGPMPIIAGKHYGLGPYDDESDFFAKLVQLRDIICHEVRMVHIPDTQDPIAYWVEPKGKIRVVFAKKDQAQVADEEYLTAQRRRYEAGWVETIKTRRRSS